MLFPECWQIVVRNIEETNVFLLNRVCDNSKFNSEALERWQLLYKALDDQTFQLGGLFLWC